MFTGTGGTLRNEAYPKNLVEKKGQICLYFVTGEFWVEKPNLCISK